MKLKELIKDVERLKEKQKELPMGEGWLKCNDILFGIKQTVEAVDRFEIAEGCGVCVRVEKDWQKLKKLLGLK